MRNQWSVVLLVAVWLSSLVGCANQETASDDAGQPTNTITHGPMLGHVTHDSVRVWARTRKPGTFRVVYGTPANDTFTQDVSPAVKTTLENDNTGVITLTGLAPDSNYYVAVTTDVDPERGFVKSIPLWAGDFRTLPDPKQLQDAKHNPRGLYNFSFEFACGNNQNPGASLGPSLPTYNTMLREVMGKVDFAILNGDWLYEEDRDYSPDAWRKQVGIHWSLTPSIVTTAPPITGVWQNYKTYLGRAKNLAKWHRHVPSYYTFDDHELLNDVFGCAEVGYRNRRAVFRDIGVRGWFDYLGWANPVAHKQPVHFGRAILEAGKDVLTDPNADFTAIDFDQTGNLHVHWGTPDAGVKDIPAGDVEGGDPNARVYEVVRVIDKHRVQIRPAATATGESSYSIGRRSYGSFRVSNCVFFLVDTRSHRNLQDLKQRDRPDLTMLGKRQLDWLKSSIQREAEAGADFFFVVSSVNFMIPHVGGGGHHFDAALKDDAWTAFLHEREHLIEFFDGLDQRVFILTGDLHNSFAVKITENVWEFASGPHNSVNHRPVDEGNRPVNGPFKFGPRPCEIRWSTTAMGDIPRENRMFPTYCVVQVNNVFNNPLTRDGVRRIAYPHPQVIFKFYNGLTGELRYSETITTRMTADD